jgi:hypothetical protein
MLKKPQGFAFKTILNTRQRRLGNSNANTEEKKEETHV